MVIALQNPCFCNQLAFILKNKIVQGSRGTSPHAALDFREGVCGLANYKLVSPTSTV